MLLSFVGQWWRQRTFAEILITCIVSQAYQSAGWYNAQLQNVIDGPEKVERMADTTDKNEQYSLAVPAGKLDAYVIIKYRS